jgi:hypothetical protein
MAVVVAQLTQAMAQAVVVLEDQAGQAAELPIHGLEVMVPARQDKDFPEGMLLQDLHILVEAEVVLVLQEIQEPAHHIAALVELEEILV